MSITLLYKRRTAVRLWNFPTKTSERRLLLKHDLASCLSFNLLREKNYRMYSRKNIKPARFFTKKVRCRLWRDNKITVCFTWLDSSPFLFCVFLKKFSKKGQKQLANMFNWCKVILTPNSNGRFFYSLMKVIKCSLETEQYNKKCRSYHSTMVRQTNNKNPINLEIR